MPTNRRKFLQNLGTGATVAGLTPLLAPLQAQGAAATLKQKQSMGKAFQTGAFRPLPLGAVRPQGWLQHQLEIMRDGTTGHLDEVYGKVRDDNGWLGGQGDGWEETPYWLDGAVPLAWLLDDKRLQEKVLRYINWTVDHQRPSGYFGPITKAEREKGVEITTANPEDGEDWWPKMVMLKVLQQYYTATEDARVIPFMQKYFRYQLATLKKCPLGHWTEWAQARGADNGLVVQWLYNQTGDAFLLDLAELLEAQTFGWSDWFRDRDWVIHAAAYQNGEQWMRRHGVNVAMALKAPVVRYQRSGNPEDAAILQTVWGDLMTLHGLPNGMFSADEDLHANDPVQGVELCAITEAMFSLEQAISLTGDLRYADALEKIAFNALPTQTTDDYNNKQYFQIANQVQVTRGVFDFSLPFSREMNNVFGMRSGYTCCLANMHQGWTKLASQLWQATDDGGIAALAYAPNQCRFQSKAGQTVEITTATHYPFSDTLTFTVKSDEAETFPLHLRIPAWCTQAELLVNGKKASDLQPKAGTLVKLARQWQSGDQVTLRLPMEVRTAECGRNSRSVERGPLVYALKQEERWEKAEEEHEGEYYSVYPKGDWNYGLLKKAIENPADHFKVQEVKPAGTDFVWNLAHAPVALTAKAKKIPDWTLAGGVAPAPITDRTGIYRGKVADTEEQITLVPYGCTKVRIVAFPVVPA